ncbi:MAG: patatin-like phospholipase family protein, partial [Candidatus Omnitrophota bacterium]
VQGSGSSTYAANLALALKAQTDKKVLLLTLSSDLSAPLVNLADIVYDHQKMFESIVKDKLPIDVLGVKFDANDHNLLGRISQFVSASINNYNYIVFDLPNQMDDVVLKTLLQSDIVHLLTLGHEHELESTRHVIDKLSEQLKDKFQSDKVQVIISGVEEQGGLKPHEIKRILNYDVFLKLPHLNSDQYKNEDVYDGFSIIKVDPQTEYVSVLQRFSRQISGSLIGLVLGGGAALGLSHIGAVRILEKEKIPIDIVVGSSMGALIGALWAAGYSADDLERFGREFEQKSGILELFDPPIQRGLILFLIVIILFLLKLFSLGLLFLFLLIPLSLVPISGLVKGEAIGYWLKGKLGHKTFHDVKIPLRIVAYDLYYRKEIVINDGFLVDAVRKSIAIPGVIRPVMESGQMIIDGGVLNPLPTNILVDMGVKKIIAVNVLQSPQEVSWGQNHELELFKQQSKIIFKDHPFKYVGFWLGRWVSMIFTPNIADIVVRTLQASEYILAEASGKQADVLIHPDLQGVNWFELYEVNQLIQRGQDATIKLLPSIKALVKR